MLGMVCSVANMSLSLLFTAAALCTPVLEMYGNYNVREDSTTAESTDAVRHLTSDAFAEDSSNRLYYFHELSILDRDRWRATSSAQQSVSEADLTEMGGLFRDSEDYEELTVTMEHLCPDSGLFIQYDLVSLVQSFNRGLVCCTRCNESLLTVCWKIVNSIAEKKGAAETCPVTYCDFFLGFLGRLQPPRDVLKMAYLFPWNKAAADALFQNWALEKRASGYPVRWGIITDDMSTIPRKLDSDENFHGFVTSRFFDERFTDGPGNRLHKMLGKLKNTFTENKLKNTMVTAGSHAFAQAVAALELPSPRHTQIFLDIFTRLKESFIHPARHRAAEDAFAASFYEAALLNDRLDLLYSSCLSVATSEATLSKALSVLRTTHQKHTSEARHRRLHPIVFLRFLYKSYRRSSAEWTGDELFSVLDTLALCSENDGCVDSHLYSLLCMQDICSYNPREFYSILKIYYRGHSTDSAVFDNYCLAYLTGAASNDCERRTALKEVVEEMNEQAILQFYNATCARYDEGGSERFMAVETVTKTGTAALGRVKAARQAASGLVNRLTGGSTEYPQPAYPLNIMNQ